MIHARDRVGVLVVDDEPAIREGLRRVLEPMGYHVVLAENGRKALELAACEEIAIVLLDLQLPDLNGMELLRSMRRDHPHRIVIIITGFGTVQTAAEAMRQGAYDLLPKPFEPDQLRIAINRASEKMSLEREARQLAEEKLRTLADLSLEKSRTRSIIDALPIGVMVTDSMGRVVLFNPAFINYMGLSDEAVAGLALEDYIADEGLRRLVQEYSKGCRIDSEDSPTYEFNFGEDKYLFARGRPVSDQSGRCLGAVVTIVDITAMKVLDRLKREFVAKVSHELRSPLSTIHEQLAVVLSDLVGQVSQADEHLLSRAKEKTKGLITLIGDLLDLSRIESGIVCESPRAVQLEDLLENIISFLSTKAGQKQQIIRMHRPAHRLPPIKADPLALESIFGNLITNAINYTAEGGRIDIDLNPSDTHLRIAVRDTGYGIEARHLDKIFERFYRVKNEKTRHIDGTGLGLPIVKGLVESLGGRIEVASLPGEGSTFSVSLPVENQHSA